MVPEQVSTERQKHKQPRKVDCRKYIYAPIIDMIVLGDFSKFLCWFFFVALLFMVPEQVSTERQKHKQPRKEPPFRLIRRILPEPECFLRRLKS
ncbi:hypothetical protein GE061_007341 [Apolygus lucorum]|uniref:Uncharacterized protein n=1 Tax=Apolygus lucorum TaxID=248454 RepID=A0A8S9WVG5_APOLU|nr:hypothetical protein GE061_007341 [Apolygus lucorum]